MTKNVDGFEALGRCAELGQVTRLPAVEVVAGDEPLEYFRTGPVFLFLDPVQVRLADSAFAACFFSGVTAMVAELSTNGA
ncbi:hypothetical protein AW168_39335 [Nocardia brasiliensis]|uniref:Uncharacterized protein n=1 Tax=Nocardia brasiliensis (strain ATCC 700358 / HUJEG-1) TaxID=1133849 RepID=K0F0H4_NOCB7|nr:hypothetical protein O3I_024605 [Nocardia brasiliensis ATCC 700358]OCF84798.1 hypothetical protein AW168_39335 [Nocardia brasiliensis]